MKAYYFDDDATGDQRLPHDSGRPVSLEQLSKVGVLYYKIGDEAEVDRLAQERSYKNRDTIVVSPQSMGDVYESKVKSFFDEQ